VSTDELNYYRERAKIERQRASESTNQYVIEIHEKLAELYEKLVNHEQLGSSANDSNTAGSRLSA
jgi:hypothetical protein